MSVITTIKDLKSSDIQARLDEVGISKQLSVDREIDYIGSVIAYNAVKIFEQYGHDIAKIIDSEFSTGFTYTFLDMITTVTQRCPVVVTASIKSIDIEDVKTHIVGIMSNSSDTVNTVDVETNNVDWTCIGGYEAIDVLLREFNEKVHVSMERKPNYDMEMYFNFIRDSYRTVPPVTGDQVIVIDDAITVEAVEEIRKVIKKYRSSSWIFSPDIKQSCLYLTRVDKEKVERMYGDFLAVEEHEVEPNITSTHYDCNILRYLIPISIVEDETFLVPINSEKDIVRHNLVSSKGVSNHHNVVIVNYDFIKRHID